MQPATHRAVFLDRDGALIEERHYLHEPEKVTIFPGTATALVRLRDAGFLLFLVTNQSGVGRGYYTMADVEHVHRHLGAELAKEGVQFARIYVAPEVPGQPSRYRKPSPQALFDARDEFQLDLSRCFVIGDKLCDLECGWNAGVQASLLVRTGYGAKLERDGGEQISRAVVVNDLLAAADWILAHA